MTVTKRARVVCIIVTAKGGAVRIDNMLKTTSGVTGVVEDGDLVLRA